MGQTPVPIAGSPFTASRTVAVRNPYTGEVVGEVPSCGEEEVDRACTQAAAAHRRRDLPLHQRAEILETASRLVAEHSDRLAATITAESGKPIIDSHREVSRAAETLVFAAAEARRLGGEVVPLEASASGDNKVGFALRVPAGVVAAIAPFNFPLNLVAHKLAPAIAAGCPVVLKPAPQTPLTSLAFVGLLVDAGLPADWISVVTDSGSEAGGPLVHHPVPAVISFTGSVAVGWSIAAAAPRKRNLLELGSNAPLIIQPDADVSAVARRCVPAAFGFSGQSCISLQRVLVHRDVHAEFVEALAVAADALVVGDPFEATTDVGPLVSRRETERVCAWIDAAASAGGRVVAGGRLEGDLLRPTVVDSVPVSSALWKQEVFGPVVGVRPYRDLDEAFSLANDTDYGLHAGVFTNELSVALRAVRELDFGGVLVNEVPTWRAEQQPYGGVRDAGNTREGPSYAIEAMTDLRFVSLQA